MVSVQNYEDAWKRSAIRIDQTCEGCCSIFIRSEFRLVVLWWQTHSIDVCKLYYRCRGLCLEATATQDRCSLIGMWSVDCVSSGSIDSRGVSPFREAISHALLLERHRKRANKKGIIELLHVSSFSDFIWRCVLWDASFCLFVGSGAWKSLLNDWCRSFP